jgi:hypothetical protein
MNGRMILHLAHFFIAVKVYCLRNNTTRCAVISCQPIPMKQFLFSMLAMAAITVAAQSPLAAYHNKWNDAKYTAANTAQLAHYLTPQEKELIHLINLVRMHPQWFETTVLRYYPSKTDQAYLKTNSYFKSLQRELQTLKPLPALLPDSLAWVSAHCHAVSSGKKSHVGHDRITETCKKKEHFHGECCHYGHTEPLHILLSLLIDENVEDLGHRRILLGNFSRVAPAIQPHVEYGSNTVIDFLR